MSTYAVADNKVEETVKLAATKLRCATMSDGIPPWTGLQTALLALDECATTGQVGLLMDASHAIRHWVMTAELDYEDARHRIATGMVMEAYGLVSQAEYAKLGI